MVRARRIVIAVNVVAVALAFELPLISVGMYLVVTLLMPLVTLFRLHHAPT